MSLILSSPKQQTYPVDEGVNLFYIEPPVPQIMALYKQYSINGVADPEVFGYGLNKKGKPNPVPKGGKPIDGVKSANFFYDAAKLFLVGWEGVTAMVNDVETPLEFTTVDVGRLPAELVGEFTAEVVFGVMEKMANETRKQTLPN